MKFLVVGLGSIGKRHIMNMMSLGIPPADIVGVDTREDRRNEVKEKLALNKIGSTLDELDLKQFDAALLCTPTALHIEQAILLVAQGMHLFIEKPLSRNLDGIENLVKAVEKNGVKILVAYIFRFAHSIAKLKEVLDSGVIGRPLYVRGEFSEYLPDWHPWEDYRTFYMAKKSSGGGSLLDQSHIIDLAYYLFGDIETVYCVNGKLSDLEVDADDMAEIIMRFNSGLYASIHMDMFGRSHRKQLEIKGVKGNIIWDFYDYSVKVYHADEKRWDTWMFKKDANEMYMHEMRHFLNCLQGKEESLISLKEGIHTMKVILAAEKSSKTNSPSAVG